MEKKTEIARLLELRNAYEQEVSKHSNDKDFLRYKKKEIYHKVTEIIKSEMDLSPNSCRLQKYLNKTNISDLEFLFRSLNFMAGNNQRGRLFLDELLLLDEDVKKIGIEYGITSADELWKVLYAYDFYFVTHPFLENDKVRETMAKAKKLAYLDEVFRNIDNVLNYQGAYITYRYVKNYLKSVLNEEETRETDKELVYKDYNQKLELALSNLTNIASYLLEIREQIPDSRLAICNHGLSKMPRKVPGTKITFDQNIFANGIIFGTSLEKLKEGNYEDAKQLIYIPHQKVLNSKGVK